jgi:hypothetical protein
VPAGACHFQSALALILCFDILEIQVIDASLYKQLLSINGQWNQGFGAMRFCSSSLFRLKQSDPS